MTATKKTTLVLEPIPKPLLAALGCRFRGSALSAKKVLDVLQYASEPFSPPALTTKSSLNLATKQILGWVLIVFSTLSPVYATTVTLLPIRQATIPSSSQLSDEGIVAQLLQSLYTLPDVQALPFHDVTENCTEQILDDAVFEIIVTDELHQTLARLETWDSPLPWQRKLAKLSPACKVDYLVDVNIQPTQGKWQITYTLIDMKQQRPVSANTFLEVHDAPLTVSKEIAKRVVRDLWRVTQAPKSPQT